MIQTQGRSTGQTASVGSRGGWLGLLRQRTTKSVVSIAGVGLHSGGRTRLTIRPAGAGTGIVFRRIDRGFGETVAATAANVVDTRLATTLGQGATRVATVEHLLAAFAGLGVDNAFVDVAGEELPVMDGSAAPFVRLLRAAGVREVAAPKRFLRVLREVAVADGEAVATLQPYDGFRVEYTMEYDHPFFNGRPQYAVVDFATATFERDVGHARTFGFLADVAKLQAAGLALGGGLDNAVVLDDDGIINDGGLRYQDEFARHKILDVIGDLYLCGQPIIGAFTGHRSGHTTNNALLRKLLADQTSYQIVTFDVPAAAPVDLYQAAG